MDSRYSNCSRPSHWLHLTTQSNKDKQISGKFLHWYMCNFNDLGHTQNILLAHQRICNQFAISGHVYNHHTSRYIANIGAVAKLSSRAIAQAKRLRKTWVILEMEYIWPIWYSIYITQLNFYSFLLVYLQ